MPGTSPASILAVILWSVTPYSRAPRKSAQLTALSPAYSGKGPGRKPGLETLFLSSKAEAIILPETSAALHVLQQIRDEAHRFAITGHRQKRARSRKTSVLESIPGMGPKRRQNLIKQFGGLQEIAKAGVEDLASVDGISQQLAQKVYDAFHTEKS